MINMLNFYQYFKNFSKEEFYAISELERPSVTLPSNIAKGDDIKSIQSWIHFLNISKASLYEIETQTVIAGKLNFIKNKVLLDDLILLIEEDSKMLYSIINNLETSKKLTPIA
jgi:four helix bundle protein